jgi:hypothetical protein
MSATAIRWNQHFQYEGEQEEKYEQRKPTQRSENLDERERECRANDQSLGDKRPKKRAATTS